MQGNDLISRKVAIEEFYKYIGSDFEIEDVQYIEKIITGIPGVEKPKNDTNFCEIIQMKCPYDHFCHTCRLYTDYEKAREKSAEMMKKREGR